MADKTIIIGGVAGGATAAARLRRRDASREIIMFEKGDYISYANCGLPYYIGDVIKSREALILQTPEIMKSRFSIDVRTASEVIQILPKDKKVRVKNLKNGEEYEESYDSLVIATGSSPVKPPIPGIDAPNIFTLWTVPDTDAIKAFIKQKKPKKAAVIGGGFIGLEMAENLNEAGLHITLIEMQDQVMAPLDFEMANLLHENMRMNNVNLILKDGVKAFREKNGTTEIELSGGSRVEADLVILSIGVKPNSVLAADAGIRLNPRGGIIVDERMQTSVEDIFAVGDVTEVEQFVTGERTLIPLAGPANKQARILADNLSGGKKRYKGTMGTAVAKVFDLAAASVGLNEKQLKASGKVKNKDYFTVLIQQKSHAGYYPKATPLTLKLLFDGEGNIYGAQAVGQEGVDKRIDTISAIMGLKGRVQDLAELESAYAPPFSSAKDPVNMLGFVAENVLDGLVSFMEWDELDTLLSEKGGEDITVLDITEDMERLVFSIPGSAHIPLGELKDRMGELDRSKRIVVYCAVGVRSYNAARLLMQNGFTECAVLSGGTSFYKSMHHNDKGTGSAGIFGNPAEPGNKVQAKKAELEAAEIVEKDMKRLDCCGLQCPGPIMKVNEAIGQMAESEVLQVSATDMGFARDIDAWCRRTGNTLLKTERRDKENIVYIRKGAESCPLTKSLPAQLPQGKTLIVFSGDLDKVLASFIIANGAAAMGRPVTMFFTFWGLNALRKSNGAPVKKPFMDKMFGMMMPKGVDKLKLSNMNMAGMGTAMMKKVMKDKNVDSLESLMKQGMANGIKLVACTMSMDVMGITKEEIIDGVEFAGVASYLGDAEESNVNLFI